MKDWLLYTSTDMVNWQDRGAVASLKDFKDVYKRQMLLCLMWYMRILVWAS